MLEFGLQFSNLEIPRYRDAAQEAEALGYHLVTVPDHIVHERPGGQYDPRHLAHEAMVVGAVLCEATKRIRVGHLVLCNPFRHPAIAAQGLVTLDHLSGGRWIAGFGTGWTATEFRMTGIPFPPIDARLRMLVEALSAIRSLWTSEETTFEGEFYRFRGAILWPKPVQKPHPPILLGGGGKGLLRLAAKHADIVNLIADVGRPGRIVLEELQRLTDEAFRAKVAFVREEARRLGRNPEAIRVSNAVFTVALADSPRAARETAEGLASVFGVPPEAVPRSPLALVGTPEQCIEELRRRVREWGVSQFVFSGGAEHWMRRLMEEVLAHV